MPRRRWLTLFATCLLVSPIGFAVGHWSGAAREPGAAEQHSVSAADTEHKANGLADANDYSSVLIENLGQVEFDQALDLLQSAPKEALKAWTKRLEQLPAGPRKTAGITAFFKALSQIDASTAVDLALSLSLQDSRWTAIWSVSSAAPAADLDEVAQMFTALNEKKLSLTDLVLNWSRSDPVATAKFLSRYTGDVDNRDVGYLMENWAALDPAEAREWLANHPVHRDEDVYAGLYSGWLEHDRLAAISDLTTHADDPTFKKALQRVSKDDFKNSPDAARTFILMLQPAAQETAVDGIVGDVTAIYMSGAPDLRADGVAKWLVTLPENLWRQSLGEVLNRWREPAAIDSWTAQLPADTRDTVLAAYCRAYNSYAPTDNLRAGLNIRDPKLRQETFRNIFSELDEEARDQLLTNAELLPAEKKELMRVLERP